MNDFDLWHDYRRAVDLGIIETVNCSYDGWPLTVLADPEDYSPILHCYLCGTTTVPGILIKNKVKANLLSATLD